MNKAEQQTIVIERLSEGESLVSICKDEELPDRKTIQRWQDDDKVFDVAITRAREVGYHARAEAAVVAAQSKDVDPAKGRLAFDAERWYLGKLSNAFSDNKAQKHEHEVDLTDKAKAWLGLS